MANSMMRAAVVHESGGPDVLVLDHVPRPEPNETQVLIQVRAFGLNRAEMFTRQGHSPSVKWPRIIGIEAVGVVVACPSGHFDQGDTVATCMGGMGRSFDGSYAEYTCVPVKQVLRLQTGLDWRTLGALPEMMQTAWGSLFISLQMNRGETLLIRGGTTSIGLAASSLAKAHGIHVTSTSRKQGSEIEALLREYGADNILVDDGKLAEHAAGQFDKCLELIGVRTMEDSMQCLRMGGICCITGIAGGIWEVNAWDPMERIPVGVNLTVYARGGSDALPTPFPELAEVVGMAERGEIKVPISQSFSLEEIVEAHRIMEANTANGKLVVVI